VKFGRARVADVSPVARRSPFGFFRARTIRSRLTRVLLASLALVLALLGSVVYSQVYNYLDATDMVDTPAVAMSMADVVHQLQLERGLTNGLLFDDQRFQQMLLDQRGNTDRALTQLGQTLDGSTISGRDVVRRALDTLNAGLTEIRGGVDARHADRGQTFDYYTDRIAAFNGIQFGLAESPGSDQAHSSELRSRWKTLAYVNTTIEQTAQEAAFMTGIFAQDHIQLGDYVRFISTRARRDQAITIARLTATPAEVASWRAVLAGPDAGAVNLAENVAAAFPQNSLGHRVDDLTWWNRNAGLLDQEHSVRATLGADIHATAQNEQRHAELVLAIYLFGAVLIAAVEVFLVLGSMRSIIRPLAALQKEADDVASNRLPSSVTTWHAQAEPTPPQPVQTPSTAGAEIASVAEALDRVQTTAFELAAEQAQLRKNTTESLANLGRRNQNLVRRLLGFISELEKEELDPSALSNLFELDHLATRMRRNAESLLVLVGEISPRPWAEPIPLGDIIRAGLSEVEAYRRVVLRRVDETFVIGSAAGELAHMLAELIENGLAFSPPDLEVEIYGRRNGAGYILAVVDHGVGMTKEELAIANARLRGEEEYLVAPTRFLGHYVVGRLAQRLGIDVELTVSPVGGIAARLALPTDLIVDRKALASGSGAEWQEVSAYAAGRPSEAIEAATVDTAPPKPDRPADGTAEATATDGVARDSGRTVRRPAPAGPGNIRQPIDAVVVETSRPVRPDVQLTRNGLVKRNREVAPAAPPNAAVPATGFTPPVYPAPIQERTPEEVRNMLSQFRSGHQRGEHVKPDGGGTVLTDAQPQGTEEETR
jgi:signal transduction histidine kinase